MRAHEVVDDIFNGSRDTLYRLATDPWAGAHPGAWAVSFPQRDRPAGGYSDLAHMRSWAGGARFVPISRRTVAGGLDDHLEMRFFVNTFDPAVIQARAKLSMALVYAGVRGAGDPARGTPRREPLGSRAGSTQKVLRRRGKLAVYGPDAQPVQERLDQLAQTLFWREADIRQFKQLLAVTQWYGGRGGRDFKKEGLDPGLALPSGVPDLAPLERLARIFVTQIPGSAVFTPDWGSTAEAAQQVAAARAALGGADNEFMVVLDVRRQPQAGYEAVATGVPTDWNRDSSVVLTWEALAALLPHLGWEQHMGTALAIAVNLREQGTDPAHSTDLAQWMQHAKEMIRVALNAQVSAVPSAPF